MTPRPAVCRSLLARRLASPIKAPIFSSTCRQLSVKELPWCAPTTASNNRPKEHITVKTENTPRPVVDKFGIVSAMSRNRVIGVDGRLPWNVPENRKLFTQLTRDKVLIIGRLTYEERPNQTHIKHVRHCIVVSATAASADLRGENVTVARNFPESLEMAKLFEKDATESDNRIDCWVGGGQMIYEQALRHPAATEIHLSVINTDVSMEDALSNQATIAMFPAKYRWDNLFEEASKTEFSEFSHHVYRRR